MPAVGDPILAEDLLFARTTAGSTALAASSTTLQNVSGLSVSVSANAIYTVEVVMFAQNAAGTAEDVQYGFSFPAGASLRIGGMGPSTAGASGTTSTDVYIAESNVTSGSTTFPFGCSTAQSTAIMRGVLAMSSTAGTFQVMASQATSGVNVTSIIAFSHIILTRVG